jgi:hypothetical protein
MDHSNIPALFKTLFPLIVLVLFIFFGNKGKKRPQQRAPHQPPSPTPDNKQPSSGEPSIDEILRDLGIPIPHQPKPAPRPKPAPMKTPLPKSADDSLENAEDVLDDSGKEEQSLESASLEEEPKPAVKPAAADVRHAYYQAPEKKLVEDVIALSEIMSAEATHAESARAHEAGALAVGPDEVRKGVIWSEILQPPVSMR